MPKYSVDPDRPWLRWYDPGVANAIEIPPITVPDFLRHSAQQHPHQVATIFLGALAVMTNPLYAEKDDPAGRLAAPGRTAGPTAWARILSSPAFPVIPGGGVRR